MSDDIPNGRKTCCERWVAHLTVAFYTQTAFFPKNEVASSGQADAKQRPFVKETYLRERVSSKA